MHATMMAQADLLDRHSALLHQFKGSGDILHMEVAKVVNVQVSSRDAQVAMGCGIDDAQAKCNSFHEDCQRLTQ